MMVLTLLGLVVAAWMVGSYELLGRAPMELPPQVLAHRAHEIAQELGYTDPPADRAYRFRANWPMLRHLGKDPSPDRWDRLSSARPEPIYMWYRQSPQPLIPFNRYAMVDFNDPPVPHHRHGQLVLGYVGTAEVLSGGAAAARHHGAGSHRGRGLVGRVRGCGPRPGTFRADRAPLATRDLLRCAFRLVGDLPGRRRRLPRRSLLLSRSPRHVLDRTVVVAAVQPAAARSDERPEVAQLDQRPARGGGDRERLPARAPQPTAGARGPSWCPGPGSVGRRSPVWVPGSFRAAMSRIPGVRSTCSRRPSATPCTTAAACGSSTWRWSPSSAAAGRNPWCRGIVSWPGVSVTRWWAATCSMAPHSVSAWDWSNRSAIKPRGGWEARRNVPT